MQQDAHEFLNYLLNTIADLLQEEEKSQERQQNGKLLQNGGGGVGGSSGTGGGPGEEGEKTQQTWVHEIFQGTLTNETRCLNCEAVSGGRSKMEAVNGEMNGPESSNGCRAVLVSRHYCNGKGRFKMETVIGL